VSASTVRNRINRMEDAGVVQGYHPEIDYDKAGLQLHAIFICSAPNAGREDLAEAALEVGGVVVVHEVINGSDNVQIEAVGTDTDDMARINDELSDLGLDVVNSKILKSRRVQPFNHFGKQITETESNE